MSEKGERKKNRRGEAKIESFNPRQQTVALVRVPNVYRYLFLRGSFFPFANFA